MSRNPFISFYKISLIALTFVCLNQPCAAQPSPHDLARVEKELSQQKAAAESLARKEKATEAELESLRQKLIKATVELQKKQTEQKELESQLRSLEKETDERAQTLQESQKRLTGMISALIQLSREPPELFVLHEDSPDDHIHRGILLRALLPQLKEETNDLAKEIDQFQKLQEETSTQKRLLITARQNLQWQQHNLDQLVQARQGYLKKTVAEKETMQVQLEALSSEAKDLRQLMERVSAPSWGRTLGKQPSAKVPSLKSGLTKPVVGTIVHDFGEKDEFDVVSDGVTISAPGGSPVVAPQSGRVVFTGPFRGYGNIIILQHTGGYHSFLAGFSRIDAEMGQNVEAGEPLGVLPANGAGNKEPVVYFEWRHGNDPVDPTVGGHKARL